MDEAGWESETTAPPRRSTLLLRFLVLGCLLFIGLEFGRLADRSAERDEIHVSSARLSALAEHGVASAEASLARWIDDELLVREGERRRIHLSDPAIRRRLAANAKFVGLAPPEAPETDAVRAAIEVGMQREDPQARRRLIQRTQRLLIAESDLSDRIDAAVARQVDTARVEDRADVKIAFRQLFFSRSRHDSAHGRASEIRERLLRPGDDPFDHLGDPLPIRVDSAAGMTPDEIARGLGPAAASRIAQLEPGVWSEPIDSPYGAHLVFVERRASAAPPPDEERTRRLRIEISRQLEADALQRAMGQLREAAAVRHDDGVVEPGRYSTNSRIAPAEDRT